MIARVVFLLERGHAQTHTDKVTHATGHPTPRISVSNTYEVSAPKDCLSWLITPAVTRCAVDMNIRCPRPICPLNVAEIQLSRQLARQRASDAE